MTDVIVFFIVIAVVAVASVYIVKEKKKGTKCIGCPSAGTCPHKGNCSEKRSF